MFGRLDGDDSQHAAPYVGDALYTALSCVSNCVSTGSTLCDILSHTYHHTHRATIVDPLIPHLCTCLEEVRVSAVRTAAIQALDTAVPLAGVDARSGIETALQALIAREPSTVVKAAAQRVLDKVQRESVAMHE